MYLQVRPQRVLFFSASCLQSDLSLFQIAIYFCSCFFDNLGHSLGQIVSGRVVLRFVLPSGIFLGACSSRFGILSCQSIPQRVHHHFLRSNCCSTRVPMRCTSIFMIWIHFSEVAASLSSYQESYNLCPEALSLLVRVCLITSTYFREKGTFLLLGRTTLSDILRDGGT